MGALTPAGWSSTSTARRPRSIGPSSTAAVAGSGSSGWGLRESRRRDERRRRLVGGRRDDARRGPRRFWGHAAALAEGDGRTRLRQTSRLLLTRRGGRRAAGREQARYSVLRPELRGGFSIVG